MGVCLADGSSFTGAGPVGVCLWCSRIELSEVQMRSEEMLLRYFLGHDEQCPAE